LASENANLKNLKNGNAKLALHKAREPKLAKRLMNPATCCRSVTLVLPAKSLTTNIVTVLPIFRTYVSIMSKSFPPKTANRVGSGRWSG
jgi:hypothetical protein